MLPVGCRESSPVLRLPALYSLSMDISLFGYTATAAQLSAFLQVILIDVILSGDNAVVIGMAVAGLPAARRNRIILIGIMAATVLRILFAGIAVAMLQVIELGRSSWRERVCQYV